MFSPLVITSYFCHLFPCRIFIFRVKQEGFVFTGRNHVFEKRSKSAKKAESLVANAIPKSTITRASGCVICLNIGKQVGWLNFQFLRIVQGVWALRKCNFANSSSGHGWPVLKFLLADIFSVTKPVEDLYPTKTLYGIVCGICHFMIEKKLHEKVMLFLVFLL